MKKKEDGSLDIVGKKSVERLKSFRVFLTYHESDIDITGNYSRDTAHIVNTLSEYDIVSSQFLLDNQITNFLDLSKVDEVDNKGFHVTFLGLGKINRPIMEKMTFAYQLWGDNINKVTYHIMDREAEDRVIPFTNVFTREDRPIQEGEKVSRVPLLYRAVAEKDITDFNSYEVLSSYFAKIKASESKEEEPTRFNKNGFEIFVISASNTSMDINVAKLLQKAILHNFTDQPERLSKTVIFVRIGNAATASSFKSDPTIVTQKEINNGYLFKEDHILVPIVIFGEDALMSDFLNRHYDMIERVGTKSLLTFYKTDAEEKWLLCDKKETLVNTVTVYTLKPRLALLGYRLSDDYRITDKDGKEVEKSSYQTHVKELIDGCVYPDSGLGHPVMKLAEMEHNRWASFEYLLHSYETWKWEDFKAYNQKKLAENPDRKKFYTKNENLTCHVCMLTNKALEKLEEDLNTTFPGKEFDEYAHKLVYKNDVDTMKNVFDALCVEKKGKGERK